MKKTVPLILTVVLLLTLLSVALSACTRQPALYDLSYDMTPYTVGERAEAEGISSIDIEWFSGEVRFERADVANVSASERGGSSRGELYTMHTFSESGTLYVKCAAPGKYELRGDMVKTLTVTLPEDICLDSVIVNGYNVNVYAQGIASRRTRIRTHSGAIIMDTAAENMAAYPRDISLETFSGNVWLNVLHPVVSEGQGDGKVDVTTSSGQLDIKVNAIIPLLRLRSSSGAQAVELESGVIELDIITLSGRVDLTAKIAPRLMTVLADESVLTFKLNKNDAFELVTDAKLAVSSVDISDGEYMEDGNFKYIYQPDDPITDSRSQYSVQGKNSVLRLEQFKS